MHLYLSSFLLGNSAEELPSLAHPRTAVVVANAFDHTGAIRRVRRDSDLAELRTLGFTVEELDLRHYFTTPERLADRLTGVGLVWVTGGNVFLLRRAMRQSGLDRCLVDRKGDASFVYGGYSAGACVAAPTLRGLDLVDTLAVSVEGYQDDVLWDGLNLVPYSIAPHYQSAHPESALIENVVEYFITHKMPFVALRDGEVLITTAT